MLLALRVIVGVLSLLLLLGGLAILITGMPEGWSGIWLMVLGAVGLIAVVFERMRYGTEAVERSIGASADAGLDTGPLDSRFRGTDERFTDPTTRQRVRVWLDPDTGERRYRPDE
jgi:cell division protein FtsW (lipid II flippase)